MNHWLFASATYLFRNGGVEQYTKVTMVRVAVRIYLQDFRGIIEAPVEGSVWEKKKKLMK